jgi:hypothetical protein
MTSLGEPVPLPQLPSPARLIICDTRLRDEFVGVERSRTEALHDLFIMRCAPPALCSLVYHCD